VASFKWEGGKVTAKVHNALADAIDYAASRLVKRIRRVLNIPYPPASSPGSPPHRRSGLLRSSVYYEMSRRRLVAYLRVDEAAFYWRFLEYGTSRMAARPFLGVTVDAMRPTIAIELRRAMKRTLKASGNTTPKTKDSKKGGNKPKKASRRPISKKTVGKIKKNVKKAVKSVKKSVKKKMRNLKKSAKKLRKTIKKTRKAIKKARKPKKKTKAEKHLDRSRAKIKKLAQKDRAKQQKAAARDKARSIKKAQQAKKQRNNQLKKIAKKAVKNFRKNYKRTRGKPVDPMTLTGSKLTRYILSQARKLQ
jgi:HK97 gp10 family phage protein